MFTTKELQGISEQIARSTSAVLSARRIRLHVLGDGDEALTYDRGELAAEIGNNTAQALVETFHEMLPEVDAELQATARTMIWAQETQGAPGLARACVSSTAERFLSRVVDVSADLALEELERRLFALFLAARHLRRLPSECRFEHMLIEGKHGHICTRCGERIEQ